MKLLLDTHIWIWAKSDAARIGKRAAQELSNRNNELWISPVSVWEALALMQKGRIRMENPLLWVERAAELCKERGAKRVVMLQVSAPFHCALMQPAQDRLAELLRGLSFAAPKLPVAVNVDAALVTDPDQLRDALIRQVTGAVRWVDSMRLLIALVPAAFVEVGPGRVLSGLMRQIDRGQTCVNVEDEASLEKAIQSLGIRV